MMNKKVIIFGLLIFAIAFLFPPFEYVDFTSRAVSSMFGGSPSTDITFRPIWNDEYIYRGDDMIGSDAEIASGLWFGILGGIAFATLALAAVVGNKPKEEST